MILTVGFLSLALLAVVALFTTLLRSTAKNSNLTVGRSFAQARLEEAIEANTYWPPPTDGLEGIYSANDSGTTYFFHRLTTTPVSSSTAPAYTGGYLVEVEVWWWSADPDTARAGSGMQRTSASRFLYPEGAVVP